jgi:hypothetical protein
MIRKVIITIDGVCFKKVRYEDVKLSTAFITREIVLKWIAKTKNNVILCSEGETVELTPDEYLQCCFINNEAEQIDLINYTLKRMQYDPKR